jgi:Mg2+ and Co2+ transporter CorA
MSLLKLHPQIMEEYRDPAAGSHIAPYEQALFIKLLIQLGWAIITIHDSPVSVLENITKEFSDAVQFHSRSTSAILYQMLDRLIDENMAFVLETRRQIESMDEAFDQQADACRSIKFWRSNPVSLVFPSR